MTRGAREPTSSSARSPTGRARTRDFFDAEAERLARLCHRMAERFARGGRLIASGRSPAARSDARHVAVEFVHPVIVGKRALPAIGLAGEGGRAGRAGRARGRARRHRDRLRRRRGRGRGGRRARARARARLPHAGVRPGRRRVGVRAAGPGRARSARSWWRRSTTCSGSWSTSSSTTAGCSRAAARGPRTTPARRASSIRSSPSSEHDLEAVVDDVRRSVLAKAEEVGELRAQTLTDNRAELIGRRGRPARAARRRRPPAGARERRLGHRRDGRGCGLPAPAGPALAGAPRAGPDRGPVDPDRDRERHRHRGDLRAPGDRPRPRRAMRCWRSRPAATRRT